MCRVLYVASDSELPIIPWDVSNPKFHVSASDPDIESVRNHFSKNCVYYLGSHEGCGCGFHYNDFYEKLDKADRIDSFSRLKQYLSDAVKTNGSLEVFACWSGEEPLPCNEKSIISLSEFTNDTLGVVDGSVVGKNLFLEIEKL
jgi:hypothetical protein